MEKFKRLLGISLIAAMFAVAGCGGGGGGDGTSADTDGDGVANSQDAFPDDATRFSSFTTKQLTALTGGIFSAAVGINSNLKVVGMSDNGSQEIRGVVWTVTADGTETDQVRLKPIGGNSYSAAYGINDAGISVGESSKGSDTVAVFWSAGATASTEPTELRLLGVTGPSAAYSINTSGLKVGEALDNGGRMAAVIWPAAAALPISLGGLAADTSSAAYAINDSGDVVGESEVTGGAVHAVIWKVDANGVPATGPTDLGTLPGHVNSTALGVARLSDGKVVIVGESESAAGEINAVMWQEGLVFGYNITDLGPAGGKGSAAAISTAGLIAGWSEISGSLAMVWHALHTSPTTSAATSADLFFSQAYGVNSAGIVVGLSNDRAFIAVPNR